MAVLLIAQLGRSPSRGGPVSAAGLRSASRPSALLASASALHLPSSDFADLLEARSTTHVTFAQAPLADLSSTRRASVLTALARRVDEMRHPESTFAKPGSVAGARRDGSKLPASQAAHAWRRDDVRVACKTGKIRWDSRRWMLTFNSVKLAEEGAALFDELHLAAYTPRGIFVCVHDLKTGVSMQGKRTEVTGCKINFCGPLREDRWDAALDDALLPKLRRACRAGRLEYVPFDDPRLAASLEEAARPRPTDVAYVGVPLADCSTPTRGVLLQRMARGVDAAVHPDAAICDPLAEERHVDGSRRGGQARTDHSWRRDGTRVACRSAQLTWDRRTRRWSLRFFGVTIRPGQEASFDELWLVAYTPRGVYVYRHDLRHGLTSHGKRTDAEGSVVAVVGPMGVADWRAALDEMLLPKLDEACERVAFVSWPERNASARNLTLASREVDFWVQL
mmetsp:Transcript_37370/g.93341  ORF Transcript_37370/g.93341 Transcript_37370/m.93341 type:complete len:451 (-) Transcript_37370:151-1503(-)